MDGSRLGDEFLLHQPQGSVRCFAREVRNRSRKGVDQATAFLVDLRVHRASTWAHEVYELFHVFGYAKIRGLVYPDRLDDESHFRFLTRNNMSVRLMKMSRLGPNELY